MDRRLFINSAFGCLAGPATAAADVGLPFGRPHNNVPFLFPQEQAVYFSCYCNGARALALLDSGATQSVIDKGLAERLGLMSSSSEFIAGQTHLLQANLMSKVMVSVDNEASIDVFPACIDLSKLAGPNGVRPELVLGLDYMKQQVFELDFTRKNIAFTPQGLKIYKGEMVPVDTGAAGACCCRVRVGNESVLAMIDTGNSAALTLSPSLLSAATLIPSRVSDALVAGVDGPNTVSLFSLPEVTVGEMPVQDVPTTSYPNWQNPFHAVIGLPIISRFHVGLAFGQGKMTLASDTARQQVGFLRDLSGLGLKALPDRLVIVHVATGSPAAEGAFKIGEEIVGVDDVHVDETYGTGSLWRWRYDMTKKAAKLYMSHGDVRHIELRRYY